jgi:hypothetical protein
MSMKNSNDTIGNRTRALPVCSAVPQPTAPPRSPRTEWVETRNIREHGRRTTYRSREKHEPILVHDLLSTGRHLSGVPFVTSLKLNLCTALATQNATENKCVSSHSQNTIALQPNVFLTAIRRSPVTNMGRSVFSIAGNCQR